MPLGTAEELKGLVKDVFSESLKESEKRMQEKNEAWQKEFEKKNSDERAEITSRIEKIEKTPVQTQRVVIPGKGDSKELHYGVRVNKQLVDIFSGTRCAGAKDLIVRPELFPVMADPEKREGYAKHLLMVMKAATGNLKAKQAYEEWREKAVDLQEGTAAEGGYLVPEEYTDEILSFARLQSFALQDCRIWPMSSDVRRVPAESSSVTVSWKTEETAAAQTNPVFAEAVLTAMKLTAYTTASNELLQDSSVDIVSYLTEIFAEATGQELDNQVLNGTGSPVSGILTSAAGYSVVMASGSAHFSMLTGDHLADLIAAIPQQAEAGAKFYLHKTILNLAMKLKDTNGQYLFGAMSNAAPGTFFGYPYVKTPKAPAFADSAAETAFIAFGNLRNFALGRRMQTMALDVDPYGKFLENQTRFKLLQRWGMAIGLSTAFARLVTAAS